MNPTFEIVVKGNPAAAGKKPRNQSRKAWEGTLREALKDQARQSAPVSVALDFRLPLEAFQTTNPQNEWGPDLDNLAKPVLDALKDVIDGQDGAVLALTMTKRQASGEFPAGVLIRIKPAPDLDPRPRAVP